MHLFFTNCFLRFLSISLFPVLQIFDSILSFMFNSLEIVSTTKAMLRCKQCKTIIFSQENITEFMAYDPYDFGKLKEYAHHKKFEGQANFLLLTSQYETYSTFKIDYSKSLRLDYHPFFMMHMLLIECAKCGNQLGYQVETVNENTMWMEGRTLIDASKCAIMKDGKDEMAKLIKVFQSRLVKKLELVKNQQKPPQKDHTDLIYEKLEKIKNRNFKAKKIANSRKDQSGRDKVSQDLKRRGVSVQSTKDQTSFLQKDQKQQMSNYTLNDVTFKTDEQSHVARQFQDHTFRPNLTTESFLSISMQKPARNIRQSQIYNEEPSCLKDYTPIELPLDKREKLNMSLQLWKQRTIEGSKTLMAHPVIQKIEEHMWKLDAYEKLMMKKIVEQQSKMDRILTMVRENVLEETNAEGV